jgi:hypothetical protein
MFFLKKLPSIFIENNQTFHTMRTFLLVLCFCMTLSLAFSQNNFKKPINLQANLRHIGIYGGYNVNSIDNEVLNRLTRLHNNSHAPQDFKVGYNEMLRMKGFSAGFMAWMGKFYTDVGFDIRQTTVTARFKDVENEFQSQTLSMNSFHLGLGMNMSDPKHKVMVSPGFSIGMGKVIMKEINYRMENVQMIPDNQRTPVGVKDDSKNMSSLNVYGTAFVNIAVGGMKSPKVIIQPYVTLPMVQNDLTRAYYPSDFNGVDPTLKSRLSFWGIKFAVGI